MEDWGNSPRSAILGSGELLASVPPLLVEEPALPRCTTTVAEEVVTLENFIRELPRVVKERQLRGIPPGSPEDPIQNLFERLHLEPPDWECYAQFDPHKPYTRNLVATDGASYTLLVLCWTGESPIHDHPCDGCWARVLRGAVRECRYRRAEEPGGGLVCTQETVLAEDDGVLFIEDSMGYHKIGSCNPAEPAVTLHLYSPPYQSCRIFLGDGTRPPCRAAVCYYSMYGHKVERAAVDCEDATAKSIAGASDE